MISAMEARKQLNERLEKAGPDAPIAFYLNLVEQQVKMAITRYENFAHVGLAPFNDTPELKEKMDQLMRVLVDPDGLDYDAELKTDQKIQGHTYYTVFLKW